MIDQEIRACIIATILERFSAQKEHRQAALRDVLGITVTHVDERALEHFASQVPELPEELYGKWATLFCERLMETIPGTQLVDLCAGTVESEATLALVYVMFMESERMEKIVAADLQALGVSLSSPDDDSTLLGAWLKARMTQTYQ